MQTQAMPLRLKGALRYALTRAEDEAQTRDPELGRLMLYQLSYFRIVLKLCRAYFEWEEMDSNHRR